MIPKAPLHFSFVSFSILGTVGFKQFINFSPNDMGLIYIF